MTQPRSVLVVGCGLIGTSIALALREAGVEVYLRDSDPTHIAAAVEMGAGSADAVQDPEVVLVAAPPSQVVALARDLLEEFPRAVVSDVASTKVAVLDGVADHPGRERFVGGHPMAGTEGSGPRAASAHLLEGRSWVIVPGPDTHTGAVQRLAGLVEAVNAVAVFLDAPAHDEAVALVSHAPHMVSALVAGLLNAAPRAHLDLAGPGLRDVTRIAGSRTEMWLDILGDNAVAVRALLVTLQANLGEVIETLGSPDAATRLADVLDAGRAGTKRLPGKHGALAGDTDLVYVPVADRPGELSRLFADTEQSGVNIEDLRIDHERGRPVGLVEITVAAGTAADLVAALIERNWPAYR
jgi:prephenate dehydrogenase